MHGSTWLAGSAAWPQVKSGKAAVVRTTLGQTTPRVPLRQGEICDIDGRCVDAAEDEVFKLTTKGGKLAVEVEKARPVQNLYPRD